MEDQLADIGRAYRRGHSLRRLARQFSLSNQAAYCAIMSWRQVHLLERKQKFIDDPLYHQPGARQAVESIAAADHLAAPQLKTERPPRDLPPFFQDLYRTPLLSSARERALFLKFNFHKFQFIAARRRLDTAHLRHCHLSRLERHLRHANDCKNSIVAANMRLVVSVARKHLRPGVDLMELASEGNITLMRAVESFDFHKGNKFSTYATLALMKGFARSVPMLQAATLLAGRNSASLDTVADPAAVPARRLAQREQIRILLAHLAPAERAAICRAFDLDSGLGATQDVGSSRQKHLEKAALTKLRTLASVSHP